MAKNVTYLLVDVNGIIIDAKLEDWMQRNEESCPLVDNSSRGSSNCCLKEKKKGKTKNIVISFQLTYSVTCRFLISPGN